MRTVSIEFVDALINFAPDGGDSASGFAQQQREGTVALFNMLARNRCTYLADEVGMGKTYVALAVMSLLRYLDPHIRCLILAPRENIQHKWVKELNNFVRVNWRVSGNRVKALQGGPVWEPAICANVFEFAREALLDPDRDFFLRTPSFSVAANKADARGKLRDRLQEAVPWIEKQDIDIRSRDRFRDTFGLALNRVMPDFDLVIVDEAHNLKHGFGPTVSNRNRILGLALGHPLEDGRSPSWLRARAKRVLLLSATPFEEDYSDIQRQLEVVGHGDTGLRDGVGSGAVSASILVNEGASEADRRRVVQRLLVRRASELRIGGELHTKNMYRREWRCGGFHEHDAPIQIEKPVERLVIALMQKKVSEILQSERFNNSFQIGMLSSFESFLESMSRRQRTLQSAENDEESGGESTFDDIEQNCRANVAERQGIDTEAVREIVRSYRERFGRTLPHPKLDATAAAHADVFDTGEKALIFVRRVATVGELAAKLEGRFDDWVRARMERAIPEQAGKLGEIFGRYERERLRRPDEDVDGFDTIGAEPPPEEQDERWAVLEADEGGAESFFAWYFRGAGPPGLLSGAAFQRNRLASTSSAYSTLFEDDHVGWLLGASGDRVVGALAEATGRTDEELERSLRRDAFAQFRLRSGQREGYPRLHVFDAYQVAALHTLAGNAGDLASRATTVLEERYPGPAAVPSDPPAGFPQAGDFIGATTFFTELERNPVLCHELWPDDAPASFPFRDRFRRREQRRELLSSMARLGAAYIDLYCLAIRNLGSFELRYQRDEGGLPARLARDFVEMLDRQRSEPGFHAFRELALAAGAFDHIMAVNFPEVPAARLTENARIFAATLQKQVPVGRMHGGVNKRLVRQFRMPGFPLVLVTTDVLQEGEDLHTFCRRVVHYGVSWTSSATEQRTGRIDRIGGLFQRRFDGATGRPAPDDLIQVYFPHLRDTVEVLQVRRVLRRLNRFLELMHVTGRSESERDSHIDTSRAMVEEVHDVPPITYRLQSAFPVREEWMTGELGVDDARSPDLKTYLDHFRAVRVQLEQETSVRFHESQNDRLVDGELVDDQGSQGFRLELRSQRVGDAVLLRVSSQIGEFDLEADEILGKVMRFPAIGMLVKVCELPRTHVDRDTLLVQVAISFQPEVVDAGIVRQMIRQVVDAARHIRTSAPWDGWRRGERADVHGLLGEVDKLIAKRQLPWERRDRVVYVNVTGSRARQKVWLRRLGNWYRAYAVISDAAAIASERESTLRRLPRFAWRENASMDLTGLGIDRRGRFIAFVDLIPDSFGPDELQMYIQAVARQSSRVRYALTGVAPG